MKIELDEGYQFGLGFFETIAIEAGRPEYLQDHLERLRDALDSFGIEQKIDEDMVLAWLDKQENKEHHSLKIMVSDQNIEYLLKNNPYDQTRKDKGFDLEYSSIIRNDTSPLVRYKSYNYGDNILEKRRAVKSGIDEVVFLNTKGQITEGSTTNIFFSKGDKLYTPSISCGLLPGIMRKQLLKKYDVCEKIILPEEVKDFEACFVTNSLMGIMPVNRLGDKLFTRKEL